MDIDAAHRVDQLDDRTVVDTQIVVDIDAERGLHRADAFLQPVKAGMRQLVLRILGRQRHIIIARD